MADNRDWTKMVTIKPVNSIQFSRNGNETLPSSSIEIVNKSNGPILFKVKTTQPKNYMVRPNMGYVQSNFSLSVSIKLNY